MKIRTALNYRLRKIRGRFPNRNFEGVSKVKTKRMITNTKNNHFEPLYSAASCCFDNGGAPQRLGEGVGERAFSMAGGLSLNAICREFSIISGGKEIYIYGGRNILRP